MKLYWRSTLRRSLVLVGQTFRSTTSGATLWLLCRSGICSSSDHSLYNTARETERERWHDRLLQQSGIRRLIDACDGVGFTMWPQPKAKSFLLVKQIGQICQENKPKWSITWLRSQGLECGKCGGVTWFWSSLFLSELLRAGVEELCLWATGNGGGRGTTRLAFPVTRLYTGGLEAAIVRGGLESAMAYPPKNAKLQRCFVLNGDLHQSSKSKGCFLLCCVCIFAHDSSEVNKLHRGMEAKNQYDLNQVIFESASWKKMKKRSRCFRTWKLSKSRAGILSSNFFMSSQGPSPTPTSTMDNG